MAKRNPKLKAFIRLTKNGEVVPGSIIIRPRVPKNGKWLEIEQNRCCTTTSTTTTTTTTP